jgi:hypothetical protein
MNFDKNMYLTKPIKNWKHLGIAIERGSEKEFDSDVTGDPCIVWDEEVKSYRMFYFAQRHENGKEVNCDAHAIAVSPIEVGPGDWKKEGPLKFINPEALQNGTHKPWILMDAYHPGLPMKINGLYWLFTVSFRGRNKIIQLATAASLSGPWHVKPEPIIDLGQENDFDGYHADTVTAYWFENRGEILIFYKGYPIKAQSAQIRSPYGSSSAVAVMMPSESKARKLGKVISPSNQPGHWTGGWTSGMQLFPAAQGGWYALFTASPIPPSSIDFEPFMREPAPSLGGWAYTPEDWPISGWKVDDNPITTIDNLPQEAKSWGENTNLWRHHILMLPDGQVYLYYNSGSYGQERMFIRHSTK